MRSITQEEPRRRMSAADRRSAILDAALAAFAERGYHLTSLEAVAERAGISKALIYEHFSSKRELHNALLETWGSELVEGLMSAIAAAEPGEPRLRAGLEAFLGFVEERPGAWRVVFRDVADPDTAAWLRRLQEEVSAAVARLMAEEAPPAAAADPDWGTAVEALARQLTGSVQALAGWWDEHRDVPRERVLSLAMDFAWHGLERLSRGVGSRA